MKKKINFFLIVIFLILFWLFASIFLVYFPPSFSVVSKYHETASINNFSTNQLLKGNKIKGSILASENNLGIIFLRFDLKPVEYSGQDVIIFRIKEKGKSDWYAVNSYKSGLIYQYPFFPFGIPVINNSKGKTYEFEIISLNGNSRNAISLSTIRPVIESEYKFSRTEIFKSGKSIARFIFVKLENFLGDRESLILSYPYLLPLVIYLILFAAKSYTPTPALFYIILLAIVSDSLTDYRTVYFAGEIILILAWIFVVVKYKLDNSASFFLSAFFIILSILAILFGQSLILQKSSEWVYYLLVIGLIQTIFEIRDKNLNLMSLKTLLRISFKLKNGK